VNHVSFEKSFRNFSLIEEGQTRPNIISYIQALSEQLEYFAPRNIRDSRRLEIARENLLQIKRLARKLQEDLSLLEEEVHTLKETKDKGQ
jgi:hypothetical protein